MKAVTFFIDDTDGPAQAPPPEPVTLPNEFDFLNHYYPNNPLARQYFAMCIGEPKPSLT